MKRSIRKRMVVLLVGMLGVITATRTGFGYYQATQIADELYDEQLSNSADSCAARLQVKKGAVTVNLPLDSLEVFSHRHADTFYYEVFDTKGTRLAGNTDLLGPALDLHITGAEHFQTKMIGQEALRIVQDDIGVPEVEVKNVIVLAAETVHSRAKLTHRITSSIELAQIFVIIASLITVFVVANAVFAPLSRLRNAILKRSSTELSPVDDSAAPVEVHPLITAINDLLSRSRGEIESRNRFIANAAHQLRTPVAGLKTYSSFGVRLTDLAEIKHVMHKLDLGLDRVTHLINQLLTLARIERAVLIPIDLSPIVSETIEGLCALASEKEVELTFVQPEGAAIVNGDETGLRELSANLLENAIRYSNPKSEVKMSIVSEAGHVSFLVEDDGPGIPASEREHVFERFYRMGATAGDGSGLGLSIVKEVVLAHNAKITIDTPSTGQGTLVTVTFPSPTQ